MFVDYTSTGCNVISSGCNRDIYSLLIRQTMPSQSSPYFAIRTCNGAVRSEL